MSTKERVRELCILRFEDSLGKSEAEELESLLAKHPEARRTFVQEMEFEGLLRMCFQQIEPPPEEKLLEKVERKPGFVQRVMSRLKNLSNRRHADRYEIDYPAVKLRYKKKSSASSLGVACNISGSGVCFVGTDGMNKGETVEVIVAFEHAEKPFCKKGKVVWVEEDDDGTAPDNKIWKIGCRFTDKNDEEFEEALSLQKEIPDWCSWCDE